MLRTALLFLIVSPLVFAQSVYTLENLSLQSPTGWKLHQEFKEEDLLGMGFASESIKSDYVRIYVTSNPSAHQLDLTGISSSDQSTQTYGPVTWQTEAFTQRLPEENDNKVYYWTTFKGEHEGNTYFGYSISDSAQKSRANSELFLSSLRKPQKNDQRNLMGLSRSLTDPDYTGKKYYIGFGDHLSGFMGNEVKYDIKHTHDIFTSNIGGDYIGTKINGSGQGSSQLKAEWKKIGEVMTWNDMFVQYSSGHGHHSGLAFGVSYNEIRDNALSYPAREVIIFLMACHSGGIVNSFNNKKDVWSNWENHGRTLMVMSSSTLQEQSSTGPMTDPEEPGGPQGSAGSAFGHALWKALIGHADGHGGGAKDGYISLGEIIDYSTWKTKNMAGHSPQHTGAFNRELLMNKVPSGDALQKLLEGSSEHLSDAEVLERIQELDRATRIR